MVYTRGTVEIDLNKALGGMEPEGTEPPYSCIEIDNLEWYPPEPDIGIIDWDIASYTLRIFVGDDAIFTEIQPAAEFLNQYYRLNSIDLLATLIDQEIGDALADLEGPSQFV